VQNLSQSSTYTTLYTSQFTSTSPFVYSFYNTSNFPHLIPGQTYAISVKVTDTAGNSYLSYGRVFYIPGGFPANPQNYWYGGVYSGTGLNTQLHWVPNHSVENDTGASLVGTVSNFYTNNSYYSCLNGKSLNVWSDPNVYGTHYLVVHNGDQGSQCTYVTLLLPPGCFTTDQTVYVGNNVTCGSFSAVLADLGQPNGNGVSPAIFNIYFNGVLTNVSQAIYPNSQVEFNASGHELFLYVNNTFAGLYAYQKWAKINLLGVNSTK